MARVFVSHASDDLNFARAVCAWLREEGHKPFLNVDATSGNQIGEDWRRRIYHELLRADAVVCVVTSKFVTSVWCAAEVGIADALGCLVLPMHLEPDLDHPLMRQLQYVTWESDPIQARAQVMERLRALDARGRWGWREGQNPYPGLDPFDGSNGVFIGRNKEAQDLAGRVRRPDVNLLTIAGPSGCGKTSLLYAGLLPMLGDDPEWIVVPPWRPGDDSVSALARAMVRAAKRLGLVWAPATIHSVLREDQQGLSRLAEELLASSSGPERLLIAIDQAEEFFTRDGSADHLARLLRDAMASQVRVVTTLRSEYLDDLYALPAFAGAGMENYLVRPLEPNMLRLVIEEPARAAGLHIDPELAGRLVADTGSGKALPLLAFTLHKLANGLSRNDHISATLYEEIGGVSGALVRHADQALGKAKVTSQLTQEQIVTGLVRLVTLDGEGRRASRPVDIANIPEPLRVALSVLVDERLLIEDRDDRLTLIGVAHEALLTEWPPLNSAIADRAAALHTARSVEQAAAEWKRAGYAKHFFWDADRMTAALTNLGLPNIGGSAPASSPIVDLDTAAQEFLDKNRNHLRALHLRRRRRVSTIFTVLSTLLVLAVTASGIAAWQQQVANEALAVAEIEKKIALSRLLAITAEQVRSSDVSLATQLSLIAYQTWPTAEARGSLLDSSATHTATRVPGSVGANGPQPLALRPDGRLLAVGTPSGGVLLSDVTNPHHPFTVGALQASSANLFTVAFSRDGNTLATGGADRIVRLYDVSRPEQPRLLEPPLTGATSAIQSVVFSPNRDFLAAGSADGSVRLWNTRSLRLLGNPLIARSQDGSAPAVRAVAFSPSGNTLATGSTDGSIHLWDVSEPQQAVQSGSPLTGPQRTIFTVTISPSGRTLAAGDADGNVWLWNINDQGQANRLGEPLAGAASFVNSVAVSPNEHSLAVGSSDGTVIVWNLATRQVAARLPHPAPVTAVTFTPDGRTLATGATDGTTRLWALPGPVLTGPTDRVFNVEFSPDGNTLAAGSNDGKVWLWDVANRQRPLPLEPLTSPTRDVHFGGAIAFSPNGRTLAAGSIEGPVQLWDIANPRHPNTYGPPLAGADATAESVVFSPDGNVLAAGNDDGTVRLWNVSDPRRPLYLAKLTGPTSFVFQVAFSPNGDVLAAASDDRRVWLWDITNPSQSAVVPQSLAVPNGGVRTVAFSPTGTILAAGSDDGAVRLWDVTNVRYPNQLGQPLTVGPGHPVWLSFSPNGTTLAAGSTGHTISLWYVNKPSRPTLQATLTAANDNVFSVAFSHDGRFLAAAGLDKTVRLWNTDPEDVVAHICATVGRPITKSEWDRHIPGLPYKPPC